jgi:hypothetical protein
VHPRLLQPIRSHHLSDFQPLACQVCRPSNQVGAHQQDIMFCAATGFPGELPCQTAVVSLFLHT